MKFYYVVPPLMAAASLSVGASVAAAFVSPFSPQSGCQRRRRLSYHRQQSVFAARPTVLAASVADEQASSSSPSTSGVVVDETILSRCTDAVPAASEWAEAFGLPQADAAFYALFAAIRNSYEGGTETNTAGVLGLKGKPFYVDRASLSSALKKDDDDPFQGYFAFDDLAKALEEDFLDASRGSTDNRKGWKVTSVSTPRGSSFEDARMTLEEVNTALGKGTIIFNNIGAHIPKLAGPTLACTDACSVPGALNMYVTAPGKKTSAPPHTDRQDVVVVQSTGRKHWRVYSPPDPALKPQADMYARGKGDDNLPIYALEESLGCQLLLDVTLNPGDALFVPAGFPHTTDTVAQSDGSDDDETSIHLTFNIDTHVWELDYLSARRLALRRAGVADSALGQEGDDDNRYVGAANLIPSDLRADLFDSLPLGLLDEGKKGETLVDSVAAELERISRAIDVDTSSAVPSTTWRETVVRLREFGMEIFDVHRDMYLAAIEEGRAREAEAAMTAHLTGEAAKRAKAMTPEKMRRLSLFRVRTYFEKIDEMKQVLAEWARSGVAAAPGGAGASAAGGGALPDNWEFSLPLKVGDDVEADLGGAFFPAKVTRVAGSLYDVQFFDGDKLDGLERSMIKLLSPPATEEEGEVDTSGLTKKELKRLRKKQEKKRRKQ